MSKIEQHTPGQVDDYECNGDRSPVEDHSKGLPLRSSYIEQKGGYGLAYQGSPVTCMQESRPSLDPDLPRKRRSLAERRVMGQ